MTKTGRRYPDIPMPNINWSKHTGPPNNDVRCRRGHHWRSHVKGALTGTRLKFGLFARTPCPQCGDHYILEAQGDSEEMVVW